MSKFARIRVSVRVSGADLEPADVTRLLGVAPTRAHRRGEAHGPRAGMVRSFGMWSIGLEEAALDGIELGTAIDRLLSRLPSDPTVWQRLHEAYEVDVFCGLFMDDENEGVTLDLTTLHLLAERGLPLGLDVYAIAPAPPV